MKTEFLAPVAEIVLPECTDIFTLSSGDCDSNGLELDVESLLFEKR